MQEWKFKVSSMWPKGTDDIRKVENLRTDKSSRNFSDIQISEDPGNFKEIHNVVIVPKEMF